MPSTKTIVTTNKKGVKMLQGRWSPEEHELFVKSFDQYGRQWKLLAEVVRSPAVFDLTLC